MNNAKFKSSLSSKLAFWFEYCWLPVPGRRENFTGLLICIICHNLSHNGHITLATLPLCNLTSILKLETLCFRIPKIGQRNEFKKKANHGCYDLGRLCKLLHLSNSHGSLAPEASNNPIKIRVLNWALIWILHYSSDDQVIEMIPEIKFAIINLVIRSSGERLSSFDCKLQYAVCSGGFEWHERISVPIYPTRFRLIRVSRLQQHLPPASRLIHEHKHPVLQQFQWSSPGFRSCRNTKDFQQ